MKKLPIFSLSILLLAVVSFTPNEKLLWSPSKGATSYIVRSRPPNSNVFTEFPATSDTFFPLTVLDSGRYFGVAAANASARSEFTSEIQYQPSQASVMSWPANKTLRFKLTYQRSNQTISFEWRQTNLGVDTGWRQLTPNIDYVVSGDTLSLVMSRVASAEVTGSYTNTQMFRARLSYDGVFGSYAYPSSDFRFIRPIPLDIEKIEVIL